MKKLPLFMRLRETKGKRINDRFSEMNRYARSSIITYVFT